VWAHLSIVLTVLGTILWVSTGWSQLAFTNVTTVANVGSVAEGEGATFFDYDGDGDLDLYLSNGFGDANVLYSDDGDGTFTPLVTSGTEDTGPGRACVAGDYDNDGDPDLYLVNFNAANILYRNDGDSTFTPMVGANVGDTGPGVGAAWGDFNNDGNLDLYVVNFNAANILYSNDGDGSFTAIPGAGVGDDGPGHGVAPADFDGDGDLDLYVVNENEANVLYSNDGDSTFTNLTFVAGVGDVGSGRSAAWGDFDNDSDLDLYVVNHNNANALYRNDGDSTFTNVVGAGVGDTGPGYGVVWADFDKDGDLDLYVTNSNQANVLYSNDGDGTFTAAPGAGAGDTGAGRGVTGGDYDGDGDVDLYIANSNQANVLYRNDSDSNRWFVVGTRGTLSNHSGIGALVSLTAGGVTRIREVEGGSGYCSQNSMAVEFGLGSATTVSTLRIEWPSGAVDTYSTLPSNRWVTATESGGLVYVGGDRTGDELKGEGTAVSLSRNRPNPFAGSTLFTYRVGEGRGGVGLDASDRVTLKIYDTQGRLVRTLVDEYVPFGTHTVRWDGRDERGMQVASGVYLALFSSGLGAETRKVVALR
jgi:curli biogenesis system outer membrane secretion channel CsgG